MGIVELGKVHGFIKHKDEVLSLSGDVVLDYESKADFFDVYLKNIEVYPSSEQRARRFNPPITDIVDLEKLKSRVGVDNLEEAGKVIRVNYPATYMYKLILSMVMSGGVEIEKLLHKNSYLKGSDETRAVGYFIENILGLNLIYYNIKITYKN